MDETRGDFVKYAAVFVILSALAFGSIHVLRSTLGIKYPLMVVVSQSMVPTLGVGDFIFVSRIDDFDSVVAAPPPEGDILVYVKRGGANEYIVHRAVDKFEGEDGWKFVTKGDNNPVADGQAVPESRVVGRLVGRIPILGYFPLFIKTSGGFILVAALMIIVFFSDNLMPCNWKETEEGRFPWIFIIPFLASPIVYVAFMFISTSHLEIELAALACWYLGCFTAPLAFRDDDLCLMFWLYVFVLLIIPLGLDIVWRMTHITPSMWWNVPGSTVPVTLLLMKETSHFHNAFFAVLQLLLPGCVIFFATMAAKRRGFSPLVAASRWLRASTAPENL